MQSTILQSVVYAHLQKMRALQSLRKVSNIRNPKLNAESITRNQRHSTQGSARYLSSSSYARVSIKCSTVTLLVNIKPSVVNTTFDRIKTGKSGQKRRPRSLDQCQRQNSRCTLNARSSPTKTKHPHNNRTPFAI